MPNNSRSSHSSSLHRAVVHPILVIVLRFFLGGIMLYAGGIKLLDMPGMADAIENYRLLPHAWVNLPGILMPALEVVVGICLITGIWLDGALLIVTGLILVFLVAIESAILRGLNINCGCFGLSDSEIVGVKVLLRDGLFLLATIPIWMSRPIWASCVRSGEGRAATEESVPEPSGSDV